MKKQISERNSSAEVKLKVSKARSEMFLLQEVESSMKDLLEVFNIELTSKNDEEIAERKANLPKHLQRMDNLSKMIEKLMESSSTLVEEQLQEITEKYHSIRRLKNRYNEDISNEAKVREISKQELFKESMLKINLPKFAGYDSKLDIYSFQSEFLKIHKKTTPLRMMPDVLKYNVLDDSALLLVRSVNDIEEIWMRLKSAYWDPKLLLKKKLSQVDKISKLWKLKDS